MTIGAKNSKVHYGYIEDVVFKYKNVQKYSFNLHTILIIIISREIESESHTVPPVVSLLTLSVPPAPQFQGVSNVHSGMHRSSAGARRGRESHPYAGASPPARLVQSSVIMNHPWGLTFDWINI